MDNQIDNAGTKLDSIVQNLHTLGLTKEESKIYLELLHSPSTHLKLAHATGINRTKVYRIAEDLEKQSLITRRTDDRGTFLVASDPATLEVSVISEEQKLLAKRQALKNLHPMLTDIQQASGHEFVVHTYEGEKGFKQMLWHELKTTGEQCVFGSGTIEDLVSQSNWGERLRTEIVAAGYTIREIINPGTKTPAFTLNQAFKHRYRVRFLASELITFANQTVIYNDTVATYHWRSGQKVGVEIINKAHANMMRQLFDQNWTQATPPKDNAWLAS